MQAATVGAQEDLGYARPLDPGRDMGAVADLVEAAFREELEQVGSNLVLEMRQLATLGPLLTLAERVSSLPGGYVWEQNGRLIGNVTLSLDDATARRWFVSNVAVHPHYQGRGIGRRLMEAALTGIRRRGGRQVLLQVRTENEPAQRLYRRLGFERFDTIVEMIRPGSLAAPMAPVLALRRLDGRDWQAQLDLARAATPPAVLRVRRLEADAFRPTTGRRMREWFDSFLSGRQALRWGLEEGERLLAAVSVLAYANAAPARLDLAVRPGHRGAIEGPLTDVGLNVLARWRPRAVAATISRTHPEAVQALQVRHFATVRSLDQLALEL